MNAKTTSKAMIPIVVLALAGSLLFGVVGGPAGAQDTTTTNVSFPVFFPFARPPGTVEVIDTVEIDPELVGTQCSVTFTATNNSSVHPDSQIQLASANTVTLDDVEAFEGKVTTASSQLILGPTVEVRIVYGPDGHVSFGADAVVEAVCSEPPPPPEPSVAPSSTAAPATTVPTQVGGAVEVAQPAQPVQTQPSFTG